MPPNTMQRIATALRDAAMTYPEAHEEFPWGEVAIKVKNKVFLFMYSTDGRLSLSCKLPQSSDMALMLPFARPTGYGLGKSGWVSANFTGKEEPPVDLLREWIDESYRAVAPKKLVAGLVGDAAGERIVRSTAKTGGGAVKAAKTSSAAAKTGGGAAKATKAASAAKAGKTGTAAAKATKAGSGAKVGKTGTAAVKSTTTGGAAARTGDGQRRR